jgi:transposase-like protein
MNTNEIAKEYRLAHWAGIMREREESGLSIKAYCKNAGYHENVYFYWQRKLRETVGAGISKAREEAVSMVPSGFVAAMLAERDARPVAGTPLLGSVSIETSGVRITADSGYPADKLSALIREVARS